MSPMPPATICGNGVVNVGETCDDGNMVAGDGCENDCTASTLAVWAESSSSPISTP